MGESCQKTCRKPRAGHAKRTKALAIICCVVAAGVVGLLAWKHVQDRYQPSGDVRIVLLGETHGQGYDRELEVWEEYYRQGSRDLFVESPYYTAQYLNLWMQSDDDEILDEVYADLEGTAAHNEGYLSFLRQVKSRCPETVFHGTDVGHQYDTTGERYLAYAEERYGASSEEVARTKEAIGQGRRYYEDDCDESYREAQMVANFEQAYDDIRSSGTDEVVVGIYGSAHADPRARSWSGEEDCMAKQLRGRYGDVIAYERVS